MTLKESALVADEAPAKTVIGPLTAPAGTVAVTAFAPAPEKEAETAPNLTAVVPWSPVPPIVMLVPTRPESGSKLLIVGVTVNGADEGEPEPKVTTVIGPVVALSGTVAVICVPVPSRPKTVLTPLNCTSRTAPKLWPVTGTVDPAGPLAGRIESILALTVKSLAELTTPWSAKIVTGPVPAASGTTASTRVEETGVNVASTPANATSLTPVRPEPRSWIVSPALPPAGTSESSDGSTVKT